MSNWINNKKPIWKHVIKPCHILNCCPYGQLVEEYPLPTKRGKRSCKVFGHDCPAYYQTELLGEDKHPTKKEWKACQKEFEQTIQKNELMKQ